MRYIGFEQSARDRTDGAAALLANLGTLTAATPRALRKYLAEFLSDPRVVELPRALWWLILHGYVLRVRPRRSAEAYAKVWTHEGSPLAVFSTQLAQAVRNELARHAPGVRVELAMRYGAPSVRDTIIRLQNEGVQRVLLLPLYP